MGYVCSTLCYQFVNRVLQLLTKDPEKRLGCGPRGIAEVQDHPFFQTVDWKGLLSKKVATPLKPELNVCEIFNFQLLLTCFLSHCRKEKQLILMSP